MSAACGILSHKCGTGERICLLDRENKFHFLLRLNTDQKYLPNVPVFLLRPSSYSFFLFCQVFPAFPVTVGTISRTMAQFKLSHVIEGNVRMEYFDRPSIHLPDRKYILPICHPIRDLVDINRCTSYQYVIPDRISPNDGTLPVRTFISIEINAENTNEISVGDS
jgi:hypothetical protein